MPAIKGPFHLKVVQANLRHRRGASAIVHNILGSGEADILLIQELWFNNVVKGLTHMSGKLFLTKEKLDSACGADEMKHVCAVHQ